MPEPKSISLASLDRMVSAVEYVSSRGSATATEMARQLRVSKTTAFRLAQSLTARDWFVQESDKSYRLGPALHSIALRGHQPQSMVERLRPLLEYLQEATGETIHLTALDGRHVVYLDQLVSQKPVRSVSVIGARSPAHAVSAGLSQLALLSDERLDWFLSEPLQQHTAVTLAAEARLREELAQIRRRGYAVNRGGYRADVGGVSAAVALAGRQGALCALSVCSPMYRLDDERIAQYGKLLIGAVIQARSLLE